MKSPSANDWSGRRNYRRRGYGRAVMERAHELIRSFADCEVALLFSSGSRVARIDYTRALPTAPVMALTLRHAAELPFGPLHVHGFPW
jgi:hypothetical protein